MLPSRKIVSLWWTKITTPLKRWDNIIWPNKIPRSRSPETTISVRTVVVAGVTSPEDPSFAPCEYMQRMVSAKVAICDLGFAILGPLVQICVFAAPRVPRI